MSDSATGAMVKFNVSSGVPSTTAGAPTPAAEVSLAEVASMDPVPIHPIWTPARVHWVFGTQSKYPQFKVILCAPGSNPGETGGQGGSVCEACGCGREADLEEKQWRDRRKCHLPWFGRLRTCGEYASAWEAGAARSRVP